MRTNRKTEEKKMSMNKNIARLAVTAGLTAALSFGGVMAPVSMAFAAEGDNSITISQVEKNDSTTFKAYQIFKATVTDTENGGKTAQNITWASNTVGTPVINAIVSWENDHSLKVEDRLRDNPTAQEVADFLMAHAEKSTAGSADGQVKGTRVATDDVLYAVANAVESEKPAATNIPTGHSWTPNSANGNGYYLFVTNESSLGIDKKNTGTSPIFAVVGGNAVTVYEKTSIPTVEKKVLDDSKVTGVAITGEDEANWKDAADSQIGQVVNYKLTGTIADNYASYDSYSYKFKDTLEKGLDYVHDSLSVYALNGDAYTEIAPASYNVTEPTDSSRDLVVDFSKGEKGLKSATAKKAESLRSMPTPRLLSSTRQSSTQRRLLQGPTTGWRATPILLRSSILTTPWSQALAPRRPTPSWTIPTAFRLIRLTWAPKQLSRARNLPSRPQVMRITG